MPGIVPNTKENGEENIDMVLACMDLTRTQV